MSPAALLAATAALMSSDLSAEERAEAIAALYQGAASKGTPAKTSKVRDPNSPEAVKKRRQRQARMGDNGGTTGGTEGDKDASKSRRGRPEKQGSPILGLGEDTQRERHHRDSDLSQTEPASLFTSEAVAPTEPSPVDVVWAAYAEAAVAAGKRVPLRAPKRDALIAARVAECGIDLVIAAARGVWVDPWASQDAARCSPPYAFRNLDRVEVYAAALERRADTKTDPDAWSPRERAEHAEWAKTHPPVPLTFPLARVPDLSVPNVVDEDMRDLAATMGRDPYELCAEMERYRMSVNGEPS